MSARPFFIAALVLPLVGFVAAVAFGELRIRGAPEVELEVSGYDPRDLVRGHYIQYRLTTTAPVEKLYDYDGACVEQSAGLSRLSLFSGAVPGNCLIPVPIEFVRDSHRIYVQQERAQALEKALQGGRASVIFARLSDETWVARRLLVDGVPWQDAQLGDD